MNINLNIPWTEATLVAFDTETSGKYPLATEICELAAVKWRGGKIVDEYQTLVKVSTPMSKEVIEIHHISNEMLADAPGMSSVIKNFYNFLADGIPVAHHAPFDLGFLTPEFERARLPLLPTPILCTSLISRRVYADSPNHRLQTLIKYLNLPPQTAHRALADSKSCLSLALKCFEKASEKASVPAVTLQQLLDLQTTDLRWGLYSIADLKSHPVFAKIVEALETKQDIQIVYQGGSRPGESRTVKAQGLVRSPQGDFFVAQEGDDPIFKRYFLAKISAARI